jgi:uncharacterized surface protein with fasciclin (FAS1) repeats
MRAFRPTLVLPLLVAWALVAAFPAGAAPGQAPPPAAPAPTQNVLDMLKAAGTFTMFVKAVEDAGLTATLTGSGPVTVFAPADAAFAKVPKESLDATMANKAQLTNLLKTHIIEGQRITAEQLKTQKSLKTSAGTELQITVQDGVPAIAGAKVIKADMQASNGVIHQLDAVIVPRQP